MPNNSWTFGNRAPRQCDDLQRHENTYNTQRFSSPISESPDALYTHRESADFWNATEHTPSPPEFQGANYAHSPLVTSVRLYNDGRDRDETQFFGSTRQFNYTQASSHEEYTYPGYDACLDRSEVPGLRNPIHLNHYPAQLPHSTSPSDHAPTYHAPSGNGNTTRNCFGWRLRPVSELPDRFRGVFKFGVFNAIQSACFDQILHSEENLVISAPTGSGKTVLFELSMIRILTQTGNDGTAKCVYVAPTKALCSEKHNEWTAKFGGLGIKCCELTGDTLLSGRGVWGDAKSSHIIVTTAEKWDSLTRNWADHSRILSQVKLFLVDEVHVLNESRGSTLEVVVSRMKARGSNIRFLLLSATVPNVEDVACWIGNGDGSDEPARIFQFGEEFRPCKLTKFVYGVAKPKGQNDFAYARTLDLRLFTVIQQHSINKPILVFCPTRKGTLDTAKQLAKDYEQAMKEKKKLPWPPPTRINQSFHDKELTVLASTGIAVHHAGLNTDDRRTVEELYSRKALSVLVSTSTLAVGVNMPAQMVVIKGVKLYQNGEMREYSDLDIMQMMGRAGRPQFDDEGIAIILCEPELEHKYRTLTQGNTTLESSLHQNLTEHINSEIGLDTISTVENAKDWLRHSFLFRRIQKNPHHYDIGKREQQTWEEKIDEIVMQSIISLRDTQLIAYSERDGKLSSTEYGDVMSKFYIRQATMRAILNLPASTTIREILELVSISEEVSDLKLRNGEKQMYEKIRRHNDIRFPPKKTVSTSDKVLLLIQAILAGLPLNSPEFKPTEGQPYLEAISVFRHATRIITALAEVAIINQSGAQLKHALELQVLHSLLVDFALHGLTLRVRCLNAKAWEDRPLVLRQIEHIGEKSVKVLAENGINSIQKLLLTSPLRIEELLYRRPPFGLEVLAAANEFPRYYLDIKELRSIHSHGNSPVEVEFAVQCGLTFGDSAPYRVKKPKWGKTEMTTLLIVTSDMVFIDFRRIATKALNEKKEFTLTVQLTKPSQVINVYIASEKFAGVTIARTLAPNIPPDKYPTLETRPLTSIEMDLQGLEDIPDFWDIDLNDDDEVITSEVLDMAKQKPKPPHRADENASKAQQSQLNMLVKRQQAEQEPPRKRPDGKYECNHACKEKLKCRHYCCHEGLLEPPRMSKKKQQVNAHDSDGKPIPPPQNAIAERSLKDEKRSEVDARTKLVKRKPNLQESDKTHEKANAAPTPRPIGPSLELVKDTKKSRNGNATPNFDLKLTTLKRSRSLTPEEYISTDDCLEELPLISDILERSNTISKIAPVEAEGCDVPPPKRSRTNVPSTSESSRPRPSNKKVISREKTRPSVKFPVEQLFLSDSSDEESVKHCDSADSVTRDPSVAQISANDWSITQLAPKQWSRNDASTHRAIGVTRTTPHSSVQGSDQSTLRTNKSYELSPSRITGFMRRCKPYVKDHPTTNGATVNSLGLTSYGTKFVDSNTSSQTPVDPSDLATPMDDDPLAEFDRWVASGAVVIIPD